MCLFESRRGSHLGSLRSTTGNPFSPGSNQSPTKASECKWPETTQWSCTGIQNTWDPDPSSKKVLCLGNSSHTQGNVDLGETGTPNHAGYSHWQWKEQLQEREPSSQEGQQKQWWREKGADRRSWGAREEIHRLGPQQTSRLLASLDLKPWLRS